MARRKLWHWLCNLWIVFPHNDFLLAYTIMVITLTSLIVFLLEILVSLRLIYWNIWIVPQCSQYTLFGNVFWRKPFYDSIRDQSQKAELFFSNLLYTWKFWYIRWYRHIRMPKLNFNRQRGLKVKKKISSTKLKAISIAIHVKKFKSICSMELK